MLCCQHCSKHWRDHEKHNKAPVLRELTFHFSRKIKRVRVLSKKKKSMERRKESLKSLVGEWKGLASLLTRECLGSKNTWGRGNRKAWAEMCLKCPRNSKDDLHGWSPKSKMEKSKRWAQRSQIVGLGDYFKSFSFHSDMSQKIIKEVWTEK